MRTLVDSCLRVIVTEPQQCLQRNEEEDGEVSFSSKALRGREASTIKCAPAVDAATDDSWKDPWILVRRACTEAAKLCEARPQVAVALGSFGRLVDGSLPGDYWEELRCDSLSLAGSRAGPSIARDLARAQARQRLKGLSTLVALDLGGCLLIDDDSVAEVVRACQTLERLGLRDCRKLTDAAVETAASLPKLLELDLGGDFNITLRGVRLGLLVPPKAEQPQSHKRKRPPELALRALGLSGLGANDAILDALRSTPELRRLGLGYGKFAAAKFASAVSNWCKLIDLRVQWTPTFDDAALEVLGVTCLDLQALDAVGTPTTVDALRRLLRRRAPPVETWTEQDDHDVDPTLQGPKKFQWLSCRYTIGPKSLLQKLATAYETSPVSIVVK